MPKAKRGSSSSATKKAKAPRSDWRTPIFYWKGVLDITHWKGTWVASTDGLPSDAVFKESANSFNLQISDDPFVTFEGDNTRGFSGKYKLDNGNGLQDFADMEHKIAFAEYPSGHPFAGLPDDLAGKEDLKKQYRGGICYSTIIGARGSTEFGEFVSLGRMDKHFMSGYATLTLARRYIADGDPRCKLSCADIVERIGSGPDTAHRETPWTALPWRVAADWPAAVPHEGA